MSNGPTLDVTTTTETDTTDTDTATDTTYTATATMTLVSPLGILASRVRTTYPDKFGCSDRIAPRHDGSFLFL